MNETVKLTRTTVGRAVALALAAVLLLAPVAWALGELSQKPGIAACVSEDGSGGLCQNGKALQNAFRIAVSPDGKSAYVASALSDAVAVFDRDPATGALTQKPGTAGCVAENGTGGACQDGTALDGTISVTTSPDGKSAYVASFLSDAVAVFDRDPATGVLAQKPGTAGCVSEDGSGGACQDGTALDGTSGVATSDDGKSAYVASAESGAVAVFDRDPGTGALTQKPGIAGCVSDDGSGGLCQDGTALAGAIGVATSPDGKSVYVTSQLSNAVAVFDRDPATGALTQKTGTAGCVAENGTGGLCKDGTALDAPSLVATSPDGKSAYVTSQLSNAVAVFDRDPGTGALTQKPGIAGCVSDDGSGGLCQDGTALAGAIGVATSPDGKSAYVASAESDAVAVFDRDPATGALAQKPGLACVSENGGACQDGTALDGAAGVATSPDGTSVYVTSIESDAVAVFDRALRPPPPSPPPPPPPPPPPRDTLAPTVSGFTLAPSRFRVAPAVTPTDARAAPRRALTARGSRFRFTLSEPVAARILIERALAGRRVGKRCNASRRKVPNRHRCTRYQRAGTITRHNLSAGPNTIPFSGRIGRRPIAPGAYRATITATDPAGNRSIPTRASFTIVRR